MDNSRFWTFTMDYATYEIVIHIDTSDGIVDNRACEKDIDRMKSWFDIARMINREKECKSGREFLQELREEDEILNKYEDRIFNKEDDKVLTGQELHDEGLKHLIQRQKDRNNNQ